MATIPWLVDVLRGAGVEAFVVGEVVERHGRALVERAT